MRGRAALNLLFHQRQGGQLRRADGSRRSRSLLSQPGYLAFHLHLLFQHLLEDHHHLDKGCAARRHLQPLLNYRLITQASADQVIGSRGEARKGKLAVFTRGHGKPVLRQQDAAGEGAGNAGDGLILLCHRLTFKVLHLWQAGQA